MKKSSKFKVQSSKFQEGFTLIELLVVIGVVVVAGGTIGGILFSSLRGGVKSDAMIIVRQNGSYAINQVAKMIRNAKSFEGVSVDNGVNYITDCSGIVAPMPSPMHVKITSFDDNQTVFSCSGSPLTIASNSSSLLDTTAVSIPDDKCYFTCSQSNIADYPKIGIYFKLEAKNTTGIAERKAEIPFETSVILRNVGK